MSAVMQINISEALLAPNESFAFTFYEHLPDVEFLEAGLKDDQKISVKGSYTYEAGQIVVCAEVCAELSARCARCGMTLRYRVEERQTEPFFRSGEAAHYEGYTFDAPMLRLDDWVRDVVLTALPMQIYCSGQCKGACPACGADLNKGPCPHIDSTLSRNDL